MYLFLAEGPRRGLLTASQCWQRCFPDGPGNHGVPEHEESRCVTFWPSHTRFMIWGPLAFFLQFCMRSGIFKTWPNTEALKTLWKAQNPGNYLKSTEMGTLGMEPVTVQFLKAYLGHFKETKKAVSEARPIEYAWTEVHTAYPTLPRSPGGSYLQTRLKPLL